MAAPELRLNVSLDLGFFRQQLQKLTGIAQSEFTPKLNVKFNRSTLDAELNNLQRAIKRRTYRVEIGGNLEKLPDKIKALKEQLVSLESFKVDLGIGAVKSLSKKDASKIRNELRAEILGEQKKLYIPVSIKSSITRQDVRDFKNAVQSKLTGISVKVKADLESASISGGAKSRADIDADVRRGLEAISEIGAARMAGKTGGVTESARREQLKQSLTTGGFGIDELKNIGKQLGVTNVGRFKNVNNLIERIVADASVEMVKKYLDPQAVMRNPDRSGLSKVLDTFARGVFNMLGMDPSSMLQEARQKRLPPAINWQATAVPSQRPSIGPSSTGRALPGTFPSILKLPPAYRGLPFGFDFSATEGGGGGGKGGALLPMERMLQALREQLLAIFSVEEVKISEDVAADLKRALYGFSMVAQALSEAGDVAKRASVEEKVKQLVGALEREIDTATSRARVSPIAVSDLGRTGSPLLPAGRPPLMLPPAGGTTPIGQMRFNAVSSGAYVGQPGFMQAPSMPSVSRQSLTGQSTPLASPLGAGYYEVGKGLKGIQAAYGQAKKFLDTKKFPVTGAISEIGGEFGNAIKQVLLFGTAYKALAFLTSLPGQAFEAAKGLATYKNQLEAVTKESGTFEQSFAFVDNLATRFNVPLDSARQGFVKLYASMQPAGFDQGQIEGLFTGISKAAAAFGLSSDKVDRVNYAFAQMASKGQIMSEELKGQLGDVLPGALGLFAKAAQMSIPEFSKAMEDGAFKGKAMEQVLGNVAILLNTQFGTAAEGAAKTLQGAVNQIQNNLSLMYQAFAPIVDGVAAAFGPQVNALIKDVTDTVKVLTSTLIGGATGFDTLSPRAQGFYNAIQTLEPALRQAGSALVDMGSRLAQLAPLFVEVLATAISFAASPLARAALIATLAISGLTAALKVLEVTGLKAALKSVYAFISSLAVGIPQASGLARAALITLKLAVTGLFVGGILAGLDFLIGKILDIGGAAQKSIQDVKQLATDLDRLAGARDMVGLAAKRQEAENEVVIAERLLQTYQKLDRGEKLSGQEREFLREYGTKNPLQSGVAFAEAKLTAAMERRGMAQKSLETAQRLQDEEKVRNEKEREKMVKVDLSGGDESNTRKTNLESYRSLQDQLAKNFTQDQIDRLEKEHQAKVDRINAEFDLRETRANSFQKEAIKFERQMAGIELKRQKALLDASNEVLKAQGSIAGGVGGGGSAMGAYLQGDIGPTSTGPHFDVKKVGGGYFPRNYLDQFVQVNGRPLSAGTTVPGGTFAAHQQRGSHGWDYAFGEGRHAATLTGGAKWMEGTPTQHGERRRFQLPSGEMFQFLHGGSEGIGAGAPRKVTPDEKRDAIADQKTKLAIAQESLAVRIAEIQATREAAIAWAEYTTAITPIEEQKLQNSLLTKKNELVKSGLPEDVIEREMKQFETQQKTSLAIDVVNKMLAKKEIEGTKAAEMIAELNNNMADYNKLLGDNIALQNQQRFDASMGALRKQLDIAGIIDPGKELRARIGQEKPGYSSGQIEQEALLQEQLNAAERTKGQMQGIASSIADSFGNAFKGIISGSMTAREALAGMFQSIADSFADMVAQMIVEWMKMMILKGIQAIINPMAGLGNLGGGGDVLGSNSSAVFGINSADMNQYAPLGFANGGIAPGGFTAFANGGMVTGPTMGLVGEGRYNEAIVPLPNGKSIPVELGGASQGNVNVVVNVDAKGSQVEGNEAQSKQLGRVVSAAVQAEIVKQQRPGGLLSSSRSF
jgi:tape measure domain-containing protein